MLLGVPGKSPLLRALWEILRQATPTPEYMKVYEEAMTEIRKAVKPMKIEIIEFGSTVQDTHIDGSDVDVSLGIQCGTVEAQIRRLSDLTHLLLGHKNFRLRRTIYGARVPIVTLTYLPLGERSLYCDQCKQQFKKPQDIDNHELQVAHTSRHTRIELDISCGNTKADGTPKNTTDIVIRDLLELDQTGLSRDVVRLVKVFAKGKRFDRAKEHYFNSLSWTLMTIFVLQVEGVLPPACKRHERHVPPVEAPSVDDLVKAVLRFIIWLRDIGNEWSVHGHKAVVSVYDSNCYSQPPDGKYILDRHVVVLEDPGNRQYRGTYDNTARTVGFVEWQHIVDECQRALDCLEKDEVSEAFPHYVKGADKMLPCRGLKLRNGEKKRTH